jgi:hypothetical protein
LRLEDDQVHGEARWHFTADFEGLIDRVPCRHDDQEIDVAVGVRRAVRVGAKQNDLVRPEPPGDLTSVTADDAHGDSGPAIPAGKLRVDGRARFALHTLIEPVSPLSRQAELSAEEVVN